MQMFSVRKPTGSADLSVHEPTGAVDLSVHEQTHAADLSASERIGADFGILSIFHQSIDSFFRKSRF